MHQAHNLSSLHSVDCVKLLQCTVSDDGEGEGDGDGEGDGEGEGEGAGVSQLGPL